MKRRRRDNDIYEEYEDQGVPEQEDLYEDYYPSEDEEDPYNEGGAHLTPRDRAAYYAERDAYYARRDAYYAQRDAYYARQEEETEYNEEYDRPPRRREAPRGDYAPEDAWDTPDQARRRGGRRRRRRGRTFRTIAVLLLAAVLVLLLTGQPPVRNPEGWARTPGHSTILLAGTDKSGERTDTIMLLSLERGAGIRLLSIPRDTYTPEYAAFKINSAYGSRGGGAAGMEELMSAVARTVGFSPDGYVLVDMDAFVQTADLLGGLDFQVAADMDYDDDSQDLHIHLRAGEQHLDGEQIMQLVRFRSGYANADIGRTEVQRAILEAAVRQWLRPANVPKLPELWRLYRENMTSDLSTRNLLWVARVLLKAGRGTMDAGVLPGWADMVEGYSVYMVDRTVVDAVLQDYNPYA